MGMVLFCCHLLDHFGSFPFDGHDSVAR
jgi:hypothetical protein